MVKTMQGLHSASQQKHQISVKTVLPLSQWKELFLGILNINMNLKRELGNFLLKFQLSCKQPLNNSVTKTALLAFLKKNQSKRRSCKGSS